jgi:hypothetical protein
MNSRQTKIAFIGIAFVMAAWLLSLRLFSTREQPLTLSNTPLSFKAAEAHRNIQEFVTRFPRRVLGSLESRQATGYVHDYLQKLGYPISYLHFDARIARRKQVGRNVLAYKQGRSPEIIALIAHMDTASTTEQGAMDNGSGVGVLMELARLFSANPTHRSLLLIFSDGEEWGMLGARDIVSSYPERDRIAAVLSLDHVGIGSLGAFCLEETGQLKGYTPPWLRELARLAAESRTGEAQGLPVRSSSGLSEYLNRAVLISWSDQGPFLSSGIPAINLGGESKDRSRERRIYHTAQDTIDKLQITSIWRYGRAAELIVRTLDELPSIPKQSQGYFRISESRYLSPGVVSVLQVLSFLPLLLAFLFHVQNHYRQLNLTGVGRELLAFLGTVLPFWVIYFLIVLFRALRKIPLYALYPATPKDPILESVPWGILAAILGTALFAAACSYSLAKFSFQDMPKPEFRTSKAVLLALLLIGTLLGLFYNPYWATFFFVLPAWTWAMADPGKTPVLCLRIMILWTGITYYAALLIYASRLDLGWNFIWYQVIALSNGLFSNAAYFLATTVIAIGIRFLVIQSHGRIATDSKKRPL